MAGLDDENIIHLDLDTNNLIDHQRVKDIGMNKVADVHGELEIEHDTENFVPIHEIDENPEIEDDAENPENEDSLEDEDDTDEIPETFFDPDVFESIDKNLEDFTEDDMNRLAFKNLDHCEVFYKMYAKVKGFGVRRRPKIFSKIDSRPVSRTFVCNKEGLRAISHLTRPNRKYRHRAETRCNCKAKISFKWDPDTDNWYVSNFTEQHNHPTVPIEQVPFLRSHRKVSAADKLRIRSLMNSGIPASVAMRNFAQQAGGIRHVGFLTKDMYTAYENIKKEEIVISDAETVMAYLLGKKSSNSSFFMAYTRDAEKRIDKIFWCDGTSRIDYKAFGRVIAFDATYKINAYNKPLVVIAGVNHHRRTVPFAVALITDEKQETYRWVLEQLLEAGDGVPPYTVLTDGDKAMAAAVRAVLPNARHRLCLWHLMRNIKAHTNKRFCSGFMKCVDGCRTPSEFDAAWDELVTHYKVKDEKWAIDLYNDKGKWAEAFLSGHFFAGMRSTQRCESMNSTLKTVLNKDLLLYKFVEKYDQLVEGIRFQEDQDDYITTHTFPVIEGVLSEVKNHAARMYTRNVFLMLCKEIDFESRHIVKKEKTERNYLDGHVKTYQLNDTEIEGINYVVVYSKKLHKMWCCCMKMESIGLPCRHMFAVMKYERLDEIPNACILRRWTMRAKEHCSNPGNEEELLQADDEDAAQGRFAFLCSLSNQLCRMVSTSYERSLWLKDLLAKMVLQTEKEKKNPPPELLDIFDPKVVESKAKNKRKKAKLAAANKTESKKPNKEKPKTVPHNADVGDEADGVSAMLKRCMPNIYTTGEASSAADCYEVTHFQKMPTVFDWDPRPMY